MLNHSMGGCIRWALRGQGRQEAQLTCSAVRNASLLIRQSVPSVTATTVAARGLPVSKGKENGMTVAV
jgi:hypothetical protein